MNGKELVTMQILKTCFHKKSLLLISKSPLIAPLMNQWLSMVSMVINGSFYVRKFWRMIWMNRL